MRLSRLSAGIVAVSLVVASCGGGSGSSDTTERTRNSATTSPFANKVIFVSGETTDGLTKIYQYVFNTAGLPVVTEIFSAPVGGNVGVTDIAYVGSSNTLFWAMQDGSDLKIMSTMLGAGGTPTTHYTIPGGYPYSITTNGSDFVSWSGQTTSPQLWFGHADGRPLIVMSSDSLASVAMSPTSDTTYGVDVAGSIKTYRTGFRSRLVHAVRTVVGRPMMIDVTGNLVYYVTQYSSGRNQIVRVVPRSTDTPTVVAEASKRVISMAMTSDGSLFWADGPRPSMGDPLTPSTITWVSASDPTVTQEIVPDPALSITSIWVVEPPAQTTDATVSGETYLNGEMYCQSGISDDEPTMRSGRQYRGLEVRWFRNGELIPGEETVTHVPVEPGRYKCAVSASNIAGLVEITTPEVEVVDPSATTTTLEPTGSGSGASSTTVVTSPPTAVTYKSISVKWSYSATARVISGTFKKVAGARTYGMALSGATKKTVKCTTTKTTVTCRATLKKGQTLLTINARNSAKVIIAQRKASKTVK